MSDCILGSRPRPGFGDIQKGLPKKCLGLADCGNSMQVLFDSPLYLFLILGCYSRLLLLSGSMSECSLVKVAGWRIFLVFYTA